MKGQSDEVLDYADRSVPPDPRPNWWLFAVAQIPAILGMTCVGWWILGGYKHDFRGAIAGLAMMATLVGTLLSLAITVFLGLVSRVYGRVRTAVLVLYTLYLILWLAVMVLSFIAAQNDHGHGGGGF